MRARTMSLLALLAAILVALALWPGNKPATPKTPTWDDVVLEARAGGYRLLTTEELRGLCEQNPPGLLLVDTRQDWEHRTGHITGSVLFSMEPTAWARWKQRGALETLLGPDRERPIVFY